MASKPPRRILEIALAMPIVMFTQHASPELEQLAQDVGIRSVVSKTDTFPMVGMIEALWDLAIRLPRRITSFLPTLHEFPNFQGL